MVEEKQEEKKEELKEEEKKKPTIVEDARTTVDKLKAENDRMEANIKTLQELKAVEILGGKSNAGEQPEEKKEETAKEYAEKATRGDLNVA